MDLKTSTIETDYKGKVSTAQHVSFESSLLDKDYAHAVHCMVWSRWEGHLALNRFDPYAAVLMQVRCDGNIGFPGGIIDDDMTGLSLEEAKETSLNALVRELAEEMNFDAELHTLTKQDYLCSYRHPEPSKKFYLHFYTLEVSLESFKRIEVRALESKDFGHEIFGYTRVPLFTMEDGYQGLPMFLNQDFIRASKQQLLEGLEAKAIMPREIIDKAIQSSRANRDVVY